MHPALIAACCALAGLPPPLAQDWSDTTLIARDDDWSDVPAIVGYRGDGLVSEPGIDPRGVLADGSGTPVDVAANRADPGAFGLAAGVAEFELPNPVVALRGSATASAPQLVIALDTRGRAGIAVRLTLRDIDGSADAVEPVALQYRVGGSGEFANVPGGYVADATSAASPNAGIDSAAAGADQVTALRAVLPPAADNKELVEVRVITTDAVGRDEWVGLDDIEIGAATVTVPGCDPPHPEPWPAPADPDRPPELTDLTLTPEVFAAARRGPAIAHRGRAGAALRFKLSEPAVVRFHMRPGGPRMRFRVRGRRGLNRMRFGGRVRGRTLAPGAYTLTAVATDRAGLASSPATVHFRIEEPQD